MYYVGTNKIQPLDEVFNASVEYWDIVVHCTVLGIYCIVIIII